MSKWLLEKGITHLVTTRNTPQHNGTAERMNRTIMEKAQTIRIDADLPKYLWAELVSTAAFLYNCNQKTNPYLMMWGVEPRLTNIKSVGSQAFYSIHHFQNLGKLDPRCRKGKLVGFDEDMKSYRIWDSESGKVIQSRDVVFDCNSDNDMGEVCIDNLETNSEEKHEEQTDRPTINQGGDNEGNQMINSQDEEVQEDTTDNNQNRSEENQEQTRTSSRVKKQADRYGNWKSYLMFQKEIEKEESDNTQFEAMALQTFVKENAVIPDSFQTAKQSPEWPLWRKAIFTELDSSIENGVFELIPKEKRDKNKSLINTRWVLNKKFDTEGNLKRYKARCVARGFKQKEGIDYEETFSPTGRLSTRRYVLNHATQRKIKPQQADFVTAYLNSKLEEEEAVYISLPDGFVEWLQETKQETYTNDLSRALIKNPDGFVIKLKKTLYGLKQAARGWYTTMTDWFIKHGYWISDADPCLLISNQGDLAFAWVDNLILVGENTDELIKNISKDFKIKDLGIAQHILGMKIDYLEEEKMFINQTHYVQSLIEEYGLEDAKETGTPMQANIKLLKSTEEEAKEFKKKNLDYRSAIGSLNYLSQCTRPDITYVVGKLSQHLENPNESHWCAFKRVLRYLKGSKDYGILYQPNSGHDIVGYTDSSWAEDEESLSTSGYNFQAGSGLVSWRSKKLGGPSSSSTEAEYRVYLSASQEAQWLRKLTFDIYGEVPEKTQIWSDNQGAIQLAKNPVFHSRTKHIGVHFNFTKDLIVNKEISITYMPTEEMVADIFTKALDREKHMKFTSMMGIVPLSMIESRARGSVENGVSANLCMLSTRPSEGYVTERVSDPVTTVRAHQVDIHDPRLHEIQVHELHAHFKKVMSQKKRKKEKANIKKISSTTQEREALIDKNTMLLAEKLKAYRKDTTYKRKAQRSDQGEYKQRKVNYGKYRLRKGVIKDGNCIMSCFDRRGGKCGRVHTHVWRTRV